MSKKSPLLERAEEGIHIRGKEEHGASAQKNENEEERMPVEKIMTYMEMILERVERGRIRLQNGELEQLIKLGERIMRLAEKNEHPTLQTPDTETPNQ